MIDFIEWNETKGFWTREVWDEKKQKMGGSGKMLIFPHQKRILSKVTTFNSNEELPYETVLYSATKKSGKTTIAAAIGAWYMEEARDGTEIYVLANSQEHAEGRVMRDIQYHFQKRIEEGVYSDNPKHKNYCKLTQYRIDLFNGSFIQVLSQSFKSIAGSRHSLTLWDELWGSTSELDRRVWDEMTPIPTVNNSLRFISTYAGFENESDLLWELYLRGVGDDEHKDGQGKKVKGLEDLPCWENGNLFTYWEHEPSMPWQTEKYIESQMVSERPASFLRLHRNEWVTVHEAYIPIEWWDYAAQAYPAGNFTLWKDHPFEDWPVVAAVDAGLKRDSTALVLVGYDAQRGKVGVCYHKIWVPTPGDQVDLDVTVEKELLELYNRYKIVSIVYDPTHLIQTMLRLKVKGLPVQDFQQTQSNMIAASQLLFDLLKNKNLEAYPDETLRRHIQMAVAESNARGFRIVKTKVNAKHHIDGAIALAMACYAAVDTGGVDISIPVVIRNPYLNPLPPTDMDIPPELRT